MKKRMIEQNVREELAYVRRCIELTEKKISFTNEPKLIDALTFELLSLRSRQGYLIDLSKQGI
jgi:hypothetical protein